MSEAPDQRLLEALLDSWDRNNTLLLNLPRALRAISSKMERGDRAASGALLPTGFIGAIVPDSGDLTDGLVSAKDSGVPSGFMNNQRVLVGSRFGFAYALTGDEKTALRGGVGVGYSRHDNQGLIAGVACGKWRAKEKSSRPEKKLGLGYID